MYVITWTEHGQVRDRELKTSVERDAFIEALEMDGISANYYEDTKGEL